MTTLQNMIFRHALFVSLAFTSAACFGADTKNLHRKTSFAPFIVSINQGKTRQTGSAISERYRITSIRNLRPYS